VSNQFGNDITDIYANESDNADQRLLTSLGLAQDTDKSNKSLGLQRELGLGNLALGNLNAEQDWNKFLAQFGLDRENSEHSWDQSGQGNLLQILQILMGLSGQSSSGHK
jgi:hypothetical protein